MQKDTHDFITSNSLDTQTNILYDFFREEIINASKDEDLYRIGKYRIPNLGLGHFYSPRKDSGKFFNLFGNARSRGVKYYKLAEKRIQQHKFKEAFISLGRSLHFLQDLASPTHVHLVSHYLLEDGLEAFMEKHVRELKKEHVKLIEFYHVQNYFEQLAWETSSFEPERTNTLWGKVQLFFKARRKFSEEEYHKQMQALVPRAIAYSAGLLRFFAQTNFTKNNIFLLHL